MTFSVFIILQTLSSFAKTIKNQISILESESEMAIKWIKNNPMIVNPGKFQAIISDKHKGNYTSGIININIYIYIYIYYIY